MKVSTPGLDSSLQYHAIHFIALLPKNVMPCKHPRSCPVVKLSNGKSIRITPVFHSGETVTDLGRGIKKEIGNCVKVARMVFDCR